MEIELAEAENEKRTAMCGAHRGEQEKLENLQQDTRALSVEETLLNLEIAELGQKEMLSEKQVPF